MRKTVLVMGMLLVAASAFANNLARVPEPASMALMITGLGALALKLRRK